MASIVSSPPQTVNHPQTSRIKLTFEEYINYHDRTDNRHELVRGNLVTMPTGSTLHTNICQFLLYKLQNHLVEFNLDLVTTNDMGVRTLDDTVRIPDVVVYDLKIWENIHNRKGAGVLYFLAQEKQRADTEKQRADTEKQRADKLAALLRENGINLDHI